MSVVRSLECDVPIDSTRNNAGYSMRYYGEDCRNHITRSEEQPDNDGWNSCRTLLD